MKILDIGCGPITKKEGSIGMDIRPAAHVDVVHDINNYPYPFADNEFEYIEMSHIIEHVDRPLAMMSEVHRIARHGATIRIITPHYTSQLSYGDLEHYHHFGWISFALLENTGLFKTDKYKIWFTDFYKVIGMSTLANLFPRRWEKYLSFMFPAMYIEFFLTVQKAKDKTQSLTEKSIY
ncbi:MAG TPA: class I SAM-dependent methyltransferase [Bacteroidota bacterium]|nr:class I SAM-dependent methyltransferase [Bacteroidota bacterium]